MKKNAFQYTAPLIRLHLSMMLLWGVALAVHAQDISPGAIEPVREQQQLPETMPEIVTVPAPADRPQQPEDGPVIRVTEILLTYDRQAEIGQPVKEKIAETLTGRVEQQQQSFTFGQLSELADSVTQSLREAGYLLAKAIIPPQEVENHMVGMRIYTGILESVTAENNSLYKSKSFTATFDPLIDKVVEQRRIEERVLRINDMPGVQALGSFRPGSEVGGTRMKVKVQEDPVEFYARADNYGVEATGDVRLLVGGTVNNITRHVDQFSVDAVKTFNPGDLRNARARYEIFSPSLRHSIGGSYSETRYDVEGLGFRPLDIDGDTEIANVFIDSRWVRQRNFNFSTNLGLSTKRAEVHRLNLSDGVDRLTVVNLTLIVDAVDTRFKGLHRGTLTYARGIEDFIGSMDDRGNMNSLTLVNGDPLLSGEFEKYFASYNRYQSLTGYHALLLRLAGQYTDDQLSSLEKMSLGGPYTVRAYPIGEYVNDRAAFASLAWSINGGVISDDIVYGESSWEDILTISIFADYGWGKNRDNAGNMNRREISGWGVGARFDFREINSYAEFSVATPFGSDEALNGDDQQYWIAIGVGF